MGFGILQHLTVAVSKGIHFIWKKFLSNFEDIILYKKQANYSISKFSVFFGVFVFNPRRIMLS